VRFGPAAAAGGPDLPAAAEALILAVEEALETRAEVAPPTPG
jgi:hypothetical protein